MAKDLVTRIDEIVRRRSLLKHPFYQAWTMGELPLESLCGYAAQYYHFELAYPTFLSGLHHRCSDQSIRQLLLDNRDVLDRIAEALLERETLEGPQLKILLRGEVLPELRTRADEQTDSVGSSDSRSGDVEDDDRAGGNIPDPEPMPS